MAVRPITLSMGLMRFKPSRNLRYIVFEERGIKCASSINTRSHC